MKKADALVPVYIVFFIVFVGAGSVQQFIVRFLEDQGLLWPALPLAILYISFALFRILNLFIISSLPPRSHLFLGLLCYGALPAAMLFSGSQIVTCAAAALWGWGASLAWMTASLLVVQGDDVQLHVSRSPISFALILAVLLS